MADPGPTAPTPSQTSSTQASPAVDAAATNDLPAPPDDPHAGHRHPTGGSGLALAALGIVFGDIGTSPLYTFQECVSPEHGVPPTPENIFGIISLIFWALTMVVTVKYLTFLMRADNHGEGGIMALLALVPARLRAAPAGHVGLISLLVIIGAALLFGDGIITPAISVLSALEGVEVATPALKSFIVPGTCVILFGLFALQHRGTGSIGTLFGPVMLLWFVTIGLLGAWRIAQGPQVLEALLPHHAVRFFAHHGFHGFRMLGSVVLAVTGGEALYADMGHFGRRPIQRAWLLCVFPGLLLCYFGQGALLLKNPQAAALPFYSLAPSGTAITVALVILATAATIIASQALISGVFSLTQQAIRLGYFPRLMVKHTSGEAEGQIYVPLMNWGLALACIALVLVFQKSSKLAAAYGLAVSGTMGITSIIYYVVARNTWGWPRLKAGLLVALFLSFDLPFLGASLLKFFDGGYLPVAVGVLFTVVMVIWRLGRGWLRLHTAAASPSEEQFLQELPQRVFRRVPGVAAVLASGEAGIPPVLARMVERLGVAHQTVLLLTVVTEHQPTVSAAQRLVVGELGQGIFRVVVHYGFMEHYDVPATIAEVLRQIGHPARPEDVLYMVGHETFAATAKGGMGPVTESIFSFLSRNAKNATDLFRIPPEQVIELGARIDL